MESEIHGCGIRNPQAWNPESTAWNPESKTLLDYLTWGDSSLYADVNDFLNPSIITGDNYRPHLLFLIQSKCLYVLKLTVGFESNLNNNAVRKKEKYLNLINEMSRNYRCVSFVNLSMSSLGVFSDECSTFFDMMNDIGIDRKQQRYIIKKMI